MFVSSPSQRRGVEPHPTIDEEWGLYAERDARLVGYLTRARVISPSSRVLDFGAGAGHVAAAVQRLVGQGRVTCVEADEDTASQLRTRGLETSLDFDDVSGPFDAVLAIEVIEHVDDPVAVLSKLLSLLHPAGALFLTTPCGETRRGSRDTSAYDSPSHVQFFTERSLQLALRRAGFEGIQLRLIDAMYPRDRGVRGITSWLKTLGRPVRRCVLGPTHLTGTARVASRRTSTS